MNTPKNNIEGAALALSISEMMASKDAGMRSVGVGQLRAQAPHYKEVKELLDLWCGRVAELQRGWLDLERTGTDGRKTFATWCANNTDMIEGCLSLVRVNMPCPVKESDCWGFGELPELEALVLNESRWKDIPAWVLDLSVKELRFKCSRSLGRLPEGIIYMQRLEVLDVAYSGLESLPRSFGRCKTLKYLDLSGTFIKRLPEKVDFKLDYLGIYRCPNLDYTNLPEWVEKVGAVGDQQPLVKEINRCPQQGGNKEAGKS